MAVSRQLTQSCNDAPELFGSVTITVINYGDPATINVGVGIYMGEAVVRTTVYQDIPENSSVNYVFEDLPNGSYIARITAPVSEDLEFELTCNIPCTLAVTDHEVVNDSNGQSTGSIEVTATSDAGGIEYSINYVDWQTSNIISGLPAGTYDVYVRDAQDCYVTINDVLVTSTSCDLAIDTFEKTDETDEGAGDGTATIAASSVFGGVQYKLDGGLWQSSGSFTGITPGDHILYVRDSAMCTAEQAFTIVAFIEVIPYVYVPQVNSLRFVPMTTPDNCTVFQTMDNTLFHDQQWPGMKKQCYYQLVNKCDLIRIQWQSNYENNTITLTNQRTGAETVFTAEEVELPEDYVLPEEYKIIEAELNLTGLPNGYYSVVMEGQDDDIGTYTYLGEPIHLHANHENTNLVIARNFDQANEIEYLTGITHKFRVRSEFREISNPGKRQVFEDNLGSTINLKSRLKRKIKLRTYFLPPYLNEALSVAFSLDELKVNGVEYTAEEDFAYRYFTGMNLANGEIDLTQKNFNINNSHDSGNIDSPTPGIIGVEGALLGY